MIKKLLFMSCLATVVGYTSASQLFIEPQFSDARFQPADTFHAGCINSALVKLKTTDENINSLRLILSYEPEKIQILDIKPTDPYKKILDTKIEYDKVVVSLLDAAIPNSETTSLFTVSFKSTENAEESTLGIHTPSYVMTKDSKKIPVFADQKLSFAQVLECEPDVIPPTISLVKPQTTNIPLSLDSYFVFSLKDMGKGINTGSLVITFNGIAYTGDSPALVWQNDYLAFYPKTWIPIGKQLDLQINVGDKQIYGGANSTKKTFTFSSQTGISFEHIFTPAMLRNMAGKMGSIYATSSECSMMSFLAEKIPNISLLPSLSSLTEKIGCHIDTSFIEQQITKNTQTIKSAFFFSVFAVLGWVLFLISFILKLHYFVSYKRHKKLVKHLQSSGSKE